MYPPLQEIEIIALVCKVNERETSKQSEELYIRPPRLGQHRGRRGAGVDERNSLLAHTRKQAHSRRTLDGRLPGSNDGRTTLSTSYYPGGQILTSHRSGRCVVRCCRCAGPHRLSDRQKRVSNIREVPGVFRSTSAGEAHARAPTFLPRFHPRYTQRSLPCTPTPAVTRPPRAGPVATLAANPGRPPTDPRRDQRSGSVQIYDGRTAARTSHDDYGDDDETSLDDHHASGKIMINLFYRSFFTTPVHELTPQTKTKTSRNRLRTLWYLLIGNYEYGL